LAAMATRAQDFVGRADVCLGAGRDRSQSMQVPRIAPDRPMRSLMLPAATFASRRACIPYEGPNVGKGSGPDTYLAGGGRNRHRCGRQGRKSRGASFRPAVPGRRGRRSRRPSIGAATAAGIGRTSNGKTPGSTFSKRWDVTMMLKPHVGDALSVRCRPPTSGRI